MRVDHAMMFPQRWWHNRGLTGSRPVDLGSCFGAWQLRPSQESGVTTQSLGNGAQLERRITLAVGRWRMWSRRVPCCPASRTLEVQAPRVEHKVTIR